MGVNGMPEEMRGLRFLLDMFGISYEDNSSLYDFMPEINIYRTAFAYGGYDWSVISGHGTYGGENGLLEVMSNAINDGDPIGGLEAAEVLIKMHECEKLDIKKSLENARKLVELREWADERLSALSEADDEEFEPIATKEQQKSEAVKRLKKLGILDQVVAEFENDGVIEYSEPTNIGGHKVGALFWLHNNPEWLEMVKEFETKYNSMAYHVIHSYTEFGEMLSILHVSSYPEEWEIDNEDIDDGYAMAYVINLTYPEFSEFGTITIAKASGGLVRVG